MSEQPQTRRNPQHADQWTGILRASRSPKGCSRSRENRTPGRPLDITNEGGGVKITNSRAVGGRAIPKETSCSIWGPPLEMSNK